MTVITISREYGSGGDKIAIWVCGLLNYSFFNKQLMHYIATDVGLLPDEVVDYSVDNYRIRTFWEKLFSFSRTTSHPDRWIAPQPQASPPAEKLLDEADSLPMIRQTMRAARRHNNIVIVGRGGQAILKNEPGVLHVRIVAPMQIRIQRLHKDENFSLGGAKDIALKRDRAAADYLHRFHHINWNNPTLYDLVINTAKLRTQAAAQLIVNTVRALPPVPEATTAG